MFAGLQRREGTKRTQTTGLGPVKGASMNTTTQAVLEDVIETLEDGLRGFEDAANKLDEHDRADLGTTFRGFAEQRGRFSTELRNIAAAHGIEISETGSVAGSLHRGWMAVKDALSGDDPDSVLDAAEQGEDHAVSQFERALSRNDIDEVPDEIRNVLVRQYNDVRNAHDSVKSLRDRAQSS